MKYQVFNYTNDPRPWEHFTIIGEIRVDDKSYFIINDLIQRETFIRELIQMETGNDGLKKGNILASIPDERLWRELLMIAKKEGIVP